MMSKYSDLLFSKVIYRQNFHSKLIEKLVKYISFFVYLSHSILSHSLRISKISRVAPMSESLSHSLLSHSIHSPVYSAFINQFIKYFKSIKKFYHRLHFLENRSHQLLPALRKVQKFLFYNSLFLRLHIPQRQFLGAISRLR